VAKIIVASQQPKASMEASFSDICANLDWQFSVFRGDIDLMMAFVASVCDALIHLASCNTEKLATCTSLD
jgi:hypothetical protein